MSNHRHPDLRSRADDRLPIPVVDIDDGLQKVLEEDYQPGDIVLVDAEMTTVPGEQSAMTDSKAGLS